jgi:uncharacterized membrane protein YfcA
MTPLARKLPGIAGGVLGAHLVMKRGAKVVRPFSLTVVVLLLLKPL